MCASVHGVSEVAGVTIAEILAAPPDIAPFQSFLPFHRSGSLSVGSLCIMFKCSCIQDVDMFLCLDPLQSSL